MFRAKRPNCEYLPVLKDAAAKDAACLDLSGKNYNSSDVLDIIAELQTRKVVTRLNLSNNNLGSRGAEMLLQSLSGTCSPRPEVIDLSNNNIDSLDGYFITRFLETRCGRQALILDNNPCNFAKPGFTRR